MKKENDDDLDEERYKTEGEEEKSWRKINFEKNENSGAMKTPES